MAKEKAINTVKTFIKYSRIICFPVLSTGSKINYECTDENMLDGNIFN